MKRILITGANSYIGTSFEKYLRQWPEKYAVETLDMVDGSWREKSFKGYDVVYHVAGIAHIKETKENSHLYYDINRDLAVEVANKAKDTGCQQFILMSSMSVYGMDAGIITKDTIPTPKSNYGKSKLQAEEEIAKLADDIFKVCVLRPPMVYGKGCKGNFQTVIKIVKKSPVFPKVNNKRSAIYIGNLLSFIRKAVDEKLTGIYFPQNREYMNTSEMAKWIAEVLGKKELMSGVAGLGVKCIQPIVRLAKKAFGTLIYKNTEDFNFDYCIVDLEESVKKSV